MIHCFFLIRFCVRLWIPKWLIENLWFCENQRFLKNQSYKKKKRESVNDFLDTLTRLTRQYTIGLLITCTLLILILGCAFLGFRVVGGGWKSLLIRNGKTCIHSTLLNPERESGDSQKRENALFFTKKDEISQKTRIPFLSISSSIIPIWFPVPGGYYIVNIDIKEVFRILLLHLTYDLIDSLVDYLIADWNENSRMHQFVCFFEDMRDRSRLLQIDYIEYSAFYGKILHGPRYYSDWVKKEKLLYQEKTRLNWHLQFRRSGPVKMLFTRHGPIYVYPWPRDNSLKSEIKERSKFETRKLRRFFYKNYRDLLDTKLPLGAIFELDPSFKKRIQQSVDFSHLLSQPIYGGKDCVKDCLRVRTDGLNVNLFFDPTTKQIKIESLETKTDDSLIDCFIVVFRFQFTDPNRIKLPGPQPNNLGLWITGGFEQRENLTLRRKLYVVLIILYYYRYRKYFF